MGKDVARVLCCVVLFTRGVQAIRPQHDEEKDASLDKEKGKREEKEENEGGKERSKGQGRKEEEEKKGEEKECRLRS